MSFSASVYRRCSTPLLILTDDKGRELASNDDYFHADPFLRHRFTKAGEYGVAIRNSQYRGSPPSPYRLTISRQPFVLIRLRVE